MPVCAVHIAVLALGIFRYVSVLCADPLVEAVLSYHVVAQMPLAVVAAVIFVGQHLRDDRRLTRQDELVDDRSRRVRVQTRHYGGARRSAYRLRHIGVLEYEALVCKRVQVGHVEPVIAVTRHRIGALLVAEYENQVWSFCHFNLPCLNFATRALLEPSIYLKCPDDSTVQRLNLPVVCAAPGQRGNFPHLFFRNLEDIGHHEPVNSFRERWSRE